MREPRLRRVALAIVACLAIAPAVFLFSIVWRFGVDVPANDSWHLVGIFLKIASGHGELNDFVGQVNESRPAFPKLVLFALALLTNWNTRAELYLQQGVMAVLLAGLYLLARKTLSLSTNGRLFLLALTSLILYSPVQHENPLWGIQVIIFIPPACLAACALLASSGLSAWTKRIAAAALALVATYSFSNGLVLWFLVPWLIELGAASQRDAQVGRGSVWRWLAPLVFWLSTVALVLWAYFHDYARPPWHPSVSAALTEPGSAVTAFLLFLGVSVHAGTASYPRALVFGSVEGVVIAVLGALLFRYRREPRLAGSAAPWFAFLAYGVASGGLIVMGRLGFSPTYSLSSRYVAFAAMVHIAILHLGVLLTTHVSRLHAGTLVRAFAIACGLAGCVAFLWLHWLASRAAMPEYEKLYVERLQSKAAVWLIDATPQFDLQRLLWMGDTYGIRKDTRPSARRAKLREAAHPHGILLRQKGRVAGAGTRLGGRPCLG